MVAPVPGLRVTVCSDATGLAAGVAVLAAGLSDLALHPAMSAMQTARTTLDECIDAMLGIIMDFAARGILKRLAGAPRTRRKRRHLRPARYPSLGPTRACTS